jgi:hypothetical protein
MRGIYSAAYLDALSTSYGKMRGIRGLDLGKAFNLIAGTSTGAIVACGLAKGIPMRKVVDIYIKKGPGIFPEKVPSGLGGLMFQFFKRSALNRDGAKALSEALDAELGATKVIDIWKDRGIALAVPAVEMMHHRAWVFKTPHLPNSKDRDGNFTLTQVCMATSAAPIFRSMYQVGNPDGPGTFTFVDGGLWANNPVLIALIDALALTKPGDTIEIFCLGTCPPPSGDQVAADEVDRGFAEWKFGAEVPGVAISAQQFAYDNMAKMIGKHVSRDVKIIRFPTGDVPPSLQEHLDIDETSKASMDALVSHAQTDAYLALSQEGDEQNDVGQRLRALLTAAPEEIANV